MGPASIVSLSSISVLFFFRKRNIGWAMETDRQIVGAGGKTLSLVNFRAPTSAPDPTSLQQRSPKTSSLGLYSAGGEWAILMGSHWDNGFRAEWELNVEASRWPPSEHSLPVSLAERYTRHFGRSEIKIIHHPSQWCNDIFYKAK